MRWDIINSLINDRGYTSYLEIGYYKGWSFDRVICNDKKAVDPNPCKTPAQENTFEGEIIVDPSGLIFKMTSDDFFKNHSFKWDIIFIDGLHEASQVYRDIENSLKYLNEGGTIVLHDCNPPKYEHTTVGIDGCWTGDTYLGYLSYLSTHPYEYYTYDVDWGVGIIENNRTGYVAYIPKNWEEFDKNRNNLLRLQIYSLPLQKP